MKLEEIRVDAESTLAGRRVGDALGSAPVLAIRHAGGQITANPSPDVTLETGDLVLVIGEAELAAVRPAPSAGG